MIDIYVGNLNNNLDEKSLETLFKVFGEVLSTTVIKDRNNGPKCYGFVKMPDNQAGLKAIEELDGMIVAGRRLNVHKSNSSLKEDYEKDANFKEVVGFSQLSNRASEITRLIVENKPDYSLSASDDGLISIKFDKKENNT